MILWFYSSVDYVSCGIVVDVFCWLLVFASVAVVQTMCDSFYPAAVPHDQTYSRVNVVISTFADLLFSPPGGDWGHLFLFSCCFILFYDISFDVNVTFVLFYIMFVLFCVVFALCDLIFVLFCVTFLLFLRYLLIIYGVIFFSSSLNLLWTKCCATAFIKGWSPRTT